MMLILQIASFGITTQTVFAKSTDTRSQEEVSMDKNINKIHDVMETLPGPFDVIIRFDDNYSSQQVSTLSDELGLAEIETFESFDWVAASKVSKDQLYAIAKLSDVKLVELVGPPLIPEIRGGLDVATRAVKARASTQFSPNTAEDQGLTGLGMSICIIDSGVDDTIHESLNGKFVAGFNAITDTVENPDDDNGHGTHVAGIALGTGGQSQTYRGIAPRAGLIDVKVLDAANKGKAIDIIQGIDFCIANKNAFNIRVISISIVTPGFYPDGTDALSAAVNRAVNAGLVATVCAGNDGNLDTITSPGAADNAITVGALDDLNTVDRTGDMVATFSSRGLRTNDRDAAMLDEFKPEVTAPGVNIISPLFNTVSEYNAFSGCSTATPMVAGVVALLLEKKPGLTPAQVKSILQSTAEDKDSTFNGAIDPKYDRDFGWGEVDAFLALTGSNFDPIANNQAVSTNEDTPIAITLTGSDVDGDSLTFSMVTPPAHGVLSAITRISATSAQITYTPNSNFNGIDHFDYTVSDGNDGTDAAIVSVTVKSINDPPVADAGIDQTMDEGTLVTLDGTGSHDPDANSLSFSWKQISGSPVILTGANTINSTFTAPSVNATEALTFELTVTDSNTTSSADSVIITVKDTPEHNYSPYFSATGSNFIDVPDDFSLRLKKFSVAAWFRTSTDYSTKTVIVNKGGHGSESTGLNMNYGIWMTPTEKVKAGFETKQGYNKFVRSANTYNDGEWHYAAVTYDGLNLELYMDGVKVASKSTTSVPDDTGAQPLRVGANSRAPNLFFIGGIDEVRVWNRAVSAQEVADQYNSGIFDTGGQLVYLSGE